MPAKQLAISHTVYPLGYDKNNAGSTEQYNRLAKYHRSEINKMHASTSEQLLKFCAIAGEEMESLLDQSQELITTNYKRP